MLLLAIDTSGTQGSIALARGGEGGGEDRSGQDRAVEGNDFEVIETLLLVGGTFSAQLIPRISELLSRHRLSKNDIDAFAVVSGPGSFPGLRIGLAAVKALAEILQ